MNFNVLKAVGSGLSTAKFQIVEHAPQICTIGGVVCGVGAVVSAIADTRSSNVFDDLKKRDLEIQELAKAPDATFEGIKEEYVKCYNTAIKDFFKDYWKTILLSAASIALTLKGMNMFQAKVTSLGVAAAGLATELAGIKDRLSKEPTDVKNRVLFGSDCVNEENVTVINEDGTEVEEKQTTPVLGKGVVEARPFDRYLDECSQYPNNGDRDYCENITKILIGQLDNELKHSNHGYVTLDKVYRTFGAKQSKAGMRLCFKRNPQKPDNDIGITWQWVMAPKEKENGETTVCKRLLLCFDGLTTITNELPEY